VNEIVAAAFKDNIQTYHHRITDQSLQHIKRTAKHLRKLGKLVEE
jgi:hypothetical protein